MTQPMGGLSCHSKLVASPEAHDEYRQASRASTGVVVHLTVYMLFGVPRAYPTLLMAPHRAWGVTMTAWVRQAGPMPMGDTTTWCSGLVVF